MAQAKHKKQSKTYHSSRARTKKSRVSRQKLREQKVFVVSKNLMIATIIVSTMIVILTFLFVSFFNPEKNIKNHVESLTTNYYESYFYPEITANHPDDPSTILDKYSRRGFSTVSLRQLLLYNSDLKSSVATEISDYCDLNDSYIQIYPEAPFGKTDYHVEYYYSCVF